MINKPKRRSGRLRRILFVTAVILGLLIPAGVLAAPLLSYDFASPIFGLAATPDGSLLVADAGAGIVELRRGEGKLIVPLPGVSDIAPIGRGSMFAVTSFGPPDIGWRLYRVSRGQLHEIADLLAFETAVNPDGGEIDSNPFDVAKLSGNQALVADAGGNDLLVINQRRGVDWVATFPVDLLSTANIKELAECPNPPPGFEFICDLPPMIPGESVPTSVAVGPDGAYYVGELKGFPAPAGESNIWRVEPGTRQAECGSSPACTIVADGFTSIVDLSFGPDGTLYVVELDEASWAAVEIPEFQGGSLGGTVNACDISTWTCTELATDLPIPMAATVDKRGTVYAAISALIPGAAQVVELP